MSTQADNHNMINDGSIPTTQQEQVDWMYEYARRSLNVLEFYKMTHLGELPPWWTLSQNTSS
jgi:hypothetical protein